MSTQRSAVLEYDSDTEQVPRRRTEAEAPQPRPRTWTMPRKTLRTLTLTVLMPVLMGLGMALAYLGAFAGPTPHELPIGVVGTSAETSVFAQELSDKSPGSFAVRTVDTAADAHALITSGDIAGAFALGSDHATLYVSSGAGGSSADVLTKVFLRVSNAAHLPMVVDDVTPTGSGDPTGQGLFFVLVALSVGSYASAIAISAVLAKASKLWRVVTPLIVSLVIASLVMLIAGPVYHVVDHGVWNVWLLSWLYCAGVILVGVGLHAIFRHWTTLVLACMFVMLNFTSSGGVFSKFFLPSFFSALNSFWDGAAYLHAAQVAEYLNSQDMAKDALVLSLWVVCGAILVLLTHYWSTHRARIADELTRVRSSEVAVAA